ncbi:hypothetical protein JOH51_006866 [Rhizobium leguminosarum]|nr:hypothetical protein [Rhizobium leguminosarum]
MRQGKRVLPDVRKRLVWPRNHHRKTPENNYLDTNSSFCFIYLIFGTNVFTPYLALTGAAFRYLFCLDMEEAGPGGPDEHPRRILQRC